MLLVELYVMTNILLVQERLCHEFLTEQLGHEEAPWISVGTEHAEKLWRLEVDVILSESVTCEHMRGGRRCRRSYTSRRCTFRWAATECVLITGHLSACAKVLENIFIPVQLGMILFIEGDVSKALVGLLACYENCADDIENLYDYLKLYNPLL